MPMLLPLAGDTYDASNERQTRRALEDAITDLQDKFNLLLTSYGTLSIGETSLTLANGDNNNVAVGYATYVRISGPTGAFAITGISGGERGRILILRNTTSQDMTIKTESASSTAVNRIVTQTGADVATTGAGSVILIYDATNERWYLVATQT